MVLSGLQCRTNDSCSYRRQPPGPDYYCGLGISAALKQDLLKLAASPAAWDKHVSTTKGHKEFISSCQNFGNTGAPCSVLPQGSFP